MTKRAWVINASPLILMGKLDQLDLVQRLAPQLMVPAAVIHEISAGASDDGAARSAAKAHQVQLLGSLGIILRAKTNGLIPFARPLIEQLVASGSYLSANLVSAALRKVGELQ